MFEPNDPWSQRDLWDQIHEEHWLGRYSQHESAFARSVEAQLPRSQHVLELGCGAGSDASYFAKRGHSVVAVDISPYAITRIQDAGNAVRTKLEFKMLNIAEPLPFPDAEFDVVYSRLALHYFRNSVTCSIFSEICRILAPGGRLDFMCKSTKDPLYGSGAMVEPDVYVLDGHVRHFFSKRYAVSLLTQVTDFRPVAVRARRQGVYGSDSAVIVVTARRPRDLRQPRLL